MPGATANIQILRDARPMLPEELSDRQQSRELDSSAFFRPVASVQLARRRLTASSRL